MESKELILLVVGTIIVMVSLHGLWVAWRKNQKKLKFDFVDGETNAEVDEIELLRGELPNGGARLVDAFNQKSRDKRERLDPELEGTAEQDIDLGSRAVGLDKIADYNMEILTQERLDFSDPLRDSSDSKGYSFAKEKVLRSLEKMGRINFKKSEPALMSEMSENFSDDLERQEDRYQQSAKDASCNGRDVLELLVLNVLAPTGTVYHGRSMVEALQSQGLKYGDMNIFHRIDQKTKTKLFSVANALEPGTFDLSDLENVQSSGVTFFMQLPAPNDPSIIFDLMLNTARNLVLELGGSLKDEQLCVLTGQTVEHMRQRIADFSRRRMSVRA